MRLTFLLALMTYGLFAQEQVSDVDNFNTIETTNLDTRLGFAIV
ncbi:hypothetical protein N9L92_03755 [Saprospiraceae bacterium]|nr:hypothetical protein [Saprospiraceae bacterium]